MTVAVLFREVYYFETRELGRTLHHAWRQWLATMRLHEAIGVGPIDKRVF
jgi:hypothetical protein